MNTISSEIAETAPAEAKNQNHSPLAILPLSDELETASHFLLHHRFRSGVPFSLEDRHVAAGITRCGKTAIAREIIKSYIKAYKDLRVYIFDPKNLGDYSKLTKLGLPVYHVTSSIAPDDLKLPGIQIWHPERASWEEYGYWLQNKADEKNPFLLVLDEVKRLFKREGDPTSGPPALALNLQEGAGRLHAMLILLQEIAGYARQIIGQSTHLYRFRLENDYDERITERRFRRARLNGRIVHREPENFHGFFHGRVDMLDNAREYRGWQSFI